MRSTLPGWTTALVTAAVLWALPGVSHACVGDCNSNASVSIDELVRGVRIALGAAPIEDCEGIDNDRNGTVAINELVLAVGKALNGCGLGPTDEVLLTSVETVGITEYDLGTGAATQIATGLGAQVTGQICPLPGGSGNFAVGDLTGMPDVAPSWSIFSPDGTFLQRLPIPLADSQSAAAARPIGCAVDGQGRLFGTVRFDQQAGGDLVVYFPPDYTSSCILDAELDSGTREPGNATVDDAGNVYIPEIQFFGEVLPGRVLRVAPPFPSSAAECATVHPTKTTFIEYGDAIPSIGIARGHDGHFFVAVSNDGGGVAGIREHDAYGTFLRELFQPGSGGNPQALAVDGAGSLYYTEQGFVPGLDAGTVAAVWTLRQVPFDTTGTPGAPQLIDSGAGLPTGLAVTPSHAGEWLTLGGSLRRTYFNPRERQINPSTVSQLILKWRYPTGGMISAQAAVAWLDLPGEGRTQVVIVPSWDQSVYALRADNGSRVWSYTMKPQPGTFYPYSGSPMVAWVDGQARVFVPGGETMYCLDAVSGAEIWQFDAGTGCTDCTVRQERNEIESTPAVIDGLVIAGMDTNDGVPGKGGMFALRADDGRLVWWFDLVTQATCRPLPTDNVRRFDGFHSEAQLGLVEGFLATRPGCNFDRTQDACGNVWSSPAVDARRGLLFTVSANCDTDDDPSTPPPPPPPPPFEEAIFALHLDGTPAWVWRPREVDPDDFDFGAVPNLFEAEVGGTVREVVGVGGKDGTYYVLDRDGVNEISGRIEPYWQTNVVPGGPAGGMIGAASVGDGKVVVATAPGFSVFDPQKPIVHALDINTGGVLWQYSDVDPSFGPTMGVPGLAFTCSTPRPNINIFDRNSGALLRPMASAPVISGIASGPTVVSGMLFVGGGTGAHNSGSDAEGEAVRDTPLSAFCVRGAPGCTANTCNDGNPCTYDYPDSSGTCVSQPSADGIDCVAGGMRGTCASGSCAVTQHPPTPTPGEG